MAERQTLDKLVGSIGDLMIYFDHFTDLIILIKALIVHQNARGSDK
jgi:hypothetical protein